MELSNGILSTAAADDDNEEEDDDEDDAILGSASAIAFAVCACKNCLLSKLIFANKLSKYGVAGSLIGILPGDKIDEATIIGVGGCETGIDIALCKYERASSILFNF